MGLGKSAIAVRLCMEVPFSLVVCPAYLKSHWQSEFQKFTGEHPDAFGAEIVSYSQLAKLEPKQAAQCIVFDEAHYLKNPKAKRTGYAHDIVLQSKPKYLLGLTGTPIKNRVPEWWSLIRLCAYGNKLVDMQGFHSDYMAFCHFFSNEIKVKIGNHRHISKFEGVKNADKLRDMVRPMFIKKDAQGLPERVASFVQIEPEKRDLAIEKELLEDFENEENMSSAKRKNAFIKTSETIKLVEDMLAQDIRPVVFSDHIDACEKIAKHFGVKALHGKVAPEVRAEAVKDFEHGFHPVLACTIGSMSTGFSILSTNHMVFNDFPWVGTDLAQAEARIRRVTQKKTCFYKYVFSGDVDERIYKTLQKKAKTIKEVV